jgi:hypothetical protein
MAQYSHKLGNPSWAFMKGQELQQQQQHRSHMLSCQPAGCTEYECCIMSE